jgi:hypothetical protein
VSCMGYGFNWGAGLGWGSSSRKGDGLVRSASTTITTVICVTLAEVSAPSHCFSYGDTNDYPFISADEPGPKNGAGRTPAPSSRLLASCCHQPGDGSEGAVFRL